MTGFLGTRARVAFLNQPASSGGGASTGGTIAIGPDFGDGQPSASCSVGTVSLSATTTALLASKDSWVDSIALCPTDLNHNGTDLSLEGIVATQKTPIFGWDLSTYPTGATVNSATGIVRLKTAPLVSDQFNPFSIADAGETWDETTVRCSTMPAGTVDQAGGAVNTGTTSGVDLTWAMDATARARIASRMGVGAFSTRANPGALLTACVLESKDEGTNNALGPRLTFTWSKTL